jgi:hypothetical protein
MKRICLLFLTSIITFCAAYKTLFGCGVEAASSSMMCSPPNILIFESHEQDYPILSALYRLESVSIQRSRRSHISCDRRAGE